MSPDITILSAHQVSNLGIFGRGLNPHCIPGCCNNYALISRFTDENWAEYHALHVGPLHHFISPVDFNVYVHLLLYAPVHTFPPGLIEKVFVLRMNREFTYEYSIYFQGYFSDMLYIHHICFDENTQFFDLQNRITELKGKAQYEEYNSWLDRSDMEGIFVKSNLPGSYPCTYPHFDLVEQQFIESKQNLYSNNFIDLNLHVRTATLENVFNLTRLLPFSEEAAYS